MTDRYFSPWLRLEGAAVLAVSLALYALHGAGWLLLTLAFLAPDLSMLGYLRGAKTGALLYNLFHSYTPPLLLAGAGALSGTELPVALGLIWTGHVGMDRMLGYGLKRPESFRQTHLGRIGRREQPV